jgi:hypothetical protein
VLHLGGRRDEAEQLFASLRVAMAEFSPPRGIAALDSARGRPVTGASARRGA